MARIEGGERGDMGRVREWLARAVHAPRDPAWVADGHVSDRWAPNSPVTGRLDAYEWKVAEERTETVRGALLLEELAELATSAHPDTIVGEKAAREGAAQIEHAADDGPKRGDAAAESAAAAQAAEILQQAGKAKSRKANIRLAAAASSDGTEVPGSSLDTMGARGTGEAPVNGPSTAAAATTTPETRTEAKPPASPGSASIEVVKSATPASAQRREAKVEFFVPGRAPDDPGTDGAESQKVASGSR
jgi:HemY protein